jgi:hypothetical protein
MQIHGALQHLIARLLLMKPMQVWERCFFLVFVCSSLVHTERKAHAVTSNMVHTGSLDTVASKFLRLSWYLRSVRTEMSDVHTRAHGSLQLFMGSRT